MKFHVHILQGLSGAAEETVAAAVADPATVTAARSLAQTVISETALMSLGTSLGSLFSGRRLAQASIDFPKHATRAYHALMLIA